MTERDAFELRFAGRGPRLRRARLVRPRPGRARPPDRRRGAPPSAGSRRRSRGAGSRSRALAWLLLLLAAPARRAGRHGARRVAPARDRAPRPSPRRGAGPDRHRRPDPRDRGVRAGGRGRRRHPLGARARRAARAVRSRERIRAGLDDRRRRGIRGDDVLGVRHRARQGGRGLAGGTADAALVRRRGLPPGDRRAGGHRPSPWRRPTAACGRPRSRAASARTEP